MKIAISTSGNTLESPFDPRFGRAAAFCLVDVESGEWEVIQNPAASASGGAGVMAAQFIAENEAKAIVSGAFGPKAFDALSAAEIEMFTISGNDNLTVSDIVEKFKKEELEKTEKASHGGHHGGAH